MTPKTPFTARRQPNQSRTDTVRREIRRRKPKKPRGSEARGTTFFSGALGTVLSATPCLPSVCSAGLPTSERVTCVSTSSSSSRPVLSWRDIVGTTPRLQSEKLGGADSPCWRCAQSTNPADTY
eukprot:6172667-Pleurochrysis_carterae.AAC.4